jgi:ElaB/YqjD/DUF883 family membrane-anchored ribosome-binding protein
MTSWSNWGRTAESKTSRFLKELDSQDVYDQLDAVRDYLRDLTGSVSKLANRQWGQTRHRAAEVQEAEEMMKDNLAASLVVALGVGVLVGYLIRRGTE